MNKKMMSIPRHIRRAKYPVDIPPNLLDRPLRVVINYAVCYRFRVPIFRRLSACPALDVKILVGSGTPGTKISNAEDRSGINVQVMRTLTKQVRSTGRSVPLMFNPALFLWLVRLRPDVLLVQGGMLPNNLVALLYAGLTRTPIVWWSLGAVVDRRYTGLSAMYRKMVRWVERRSTAFAAYSSAGVEYFLRLGFPKDRCFNLVNVVDTELVRKQGCETRHLVPELRDQLGLKERTIVLFVGSMTETKGILTLIKSFAALGDDRRGVCLLVVGDGPERQPAEALAREYGIADDVVFTGAVYDNVAAYFQLGDLFVMPGTGGLSISEAMVHGLPVIAAIGDGSEVDLIDEGVNGYRIPPGDVTALTCCIRDMLKNSDRLKCMGEHSSYIIQTRCNIAQYMNEMLGAILYAHEHGGRRKQ